MKTFRELEQFWRPRLESLASRMVKRRDDRDHAILDLSHGLTRERAFIGDDYFADKRLLAAYVEFFWPGTYVQGREVLSQLHHAPGDALDLGAGTGATSAALLDQGATSVRAIDLSGAAIQAARGLVEGVNFEVGDITRLDLDRTYDTIVLGHVLNELWSERDDAVERRAALVEKLLGSLSQGGSLIIIEPATRENSREVLRLRDRLADRAEIVAPCFWEGPCPALADDDWCHSTFYWRPWGTLRATSERVGIRRDVAKCTYFILGDRPAREGHLDRVVSAPLHTKGRLRYVVCGDRGRHPLVLLERNLDEHNQPFARLIRGTVVRHGPTTEKGDGLRLEAGAVVEIVAEPNEPI